MENQRTQEPGPSRAVPRDFLRLNLKRFQGHHPTLWRGSAMWGEAIDCPRGQT